MKRGPRASALTLHAGSGGLPRMRTRIFLLAALLACDPVNEGAAVQAAASAAASSTPAWTPALPVRAAYALKDFKLAQCAKLGPDNVVEAKGCQPGFFGWGPYASFPADTSLEFSFEIDALTDVTVRSEFVTDMGLTVHASLPDQVIPKGTKRTIGQRVRLQVSVDGLEARIVLSSASADFRVSELRLKTF